MYAPDSVHYDVFRKGSKTYFNASRFFPKDVRTDVFSLYGFVRRADNFVDSVPQDTKGFYDFVKRYRHALAAVAAVPTSDPIIERFVELARRKQFKPEWTDAFLRSMEMDLTKKHHLTLEESLEYIYGSAEVVGLFMTRLLNLDSRADDAARMLGRAMQYINFIRDIAEDNRFGRTYLPVSESSLESLDESHVRERPGEFVEFIHAQLQRYQVWQNQAEQGYQFLPRKYRGPVKTAGDMYKWTGRQIAADPFIVYDRKVKPNRARIVISGLLNALHY